MTLQQKFEQAPDIYNANFEVVKGYSTIADEFAIEFAFYLSDNYISRTLDTWDDAVGIRFTTKEVLEIFKKEKGL